MIIIMRKMTIQHVLSLLLVSVSITSCGIRNTDIDTEVKEVDFLNKTETTIKGDKIKQLVGAKKIDIIDTLLIITTTLPEGQLEVYNTNTLELLGSFCKKGRARNEIIRLIDVNQTFISEGHLIATVYDDAYRLYEVDLTESIEKGSTIMRNIYESSRIMANTFLLGDDFNYRFEYTENDDFLGKGRKKIFSSYKIFNGNREEELKFFKSPMRVDNEKKINFPYVSTMIKHPNKNIVAGLFVHMDYLLFLNFDDNINYAVHQTGSLSFNDTYSDEEPWALHFTGCAPSSKYLMILYRNGDYTHDTMDGNYHIQELLIFDWEGNYITGAKMDRFVNRICYDEKHNCLYALNYEEELYRYDLAEIIK